MPKKDVAAKEGGEDQKSSTSSLERPHRPLNAYNLFFQEERRRMIESAQARGEASRFGFGDMARIVSKRWKSISEAEKARFQSLAELEKQRYYREMNAWYVAINDDSNTEGDDPEEDNLHRKRKSHQPAADTWSDLSPPDSQTSGAASEVMHYDHENSKIGRCQEQAIPSERSSSTFPTFPNSTSQRADGSLLQAAEAGPSSWVSDIAHPFSSEQFAPSFDRSSDLDSTRWTREEEFISSSFCVLPSPKHPIANQEKNDSGQEDIFHSVEGVTAFTHQLQLGEEKTVAQYEQQTPFYTEPSIAPEQPHEEQERTDMHKDKRGPPSTRHSSAEASRMRLLASRLGPEAIDFVIDTFNDSKEYKGI